MKSFEQWDHRDLVEDLAQAKNFTLIEVPMGGVYKNDNKVPRADVVEIKPSYDNMIVTIYEVKSSRQDLLKDLKSEKWKSYLPHCHRFYFACRKGIVSLEELPTEVGLALRNENGWYSTRTAKRHNRQPIPRETLQAYLFQRVKYQNSMDRRERIIRHYRYQKDLKQIDHDVKRALGCSRMYGSAIQTALKKFKSHELVRILYELADTEDTFVEALRFQRRWMPILSHAERELTHWQITTALREKIREKKTRV